MSTQEPLPGAPESIWAGQLDAVEYFSAIGLPWLAPIGATAEPRIVVIADLCALPQPVAEPFTLVDIAQGLNPFADHADVRLKLNTWVDRGIWDRNCHYTDATVPDPEPTQDPPPGMPDGPPPITLSEDRLDDIWKWTRFTQLQMLPREYVAGAEIFAFDQSNAAIPYLSDEHGGSWAAGVHIEVTAKPDWLGRSNGGDFPVFHDMGFISLWSINGADSPFKLAHTRMVVYGKVQRITRVVWNLPPGVEASIFPLYPVWVDMTE